MANTYELRGRHAIVMGAARGIGRAIAELLLENGAAVTVWDLVERQATRAAPHADRRGRAHRQHGITRWQDGLPGITAYSAASGGVVSFTKALGRELAGSGIYVNCVAPGPIDTDMIRGLGSQTVDAMISDSPLKRLGTAGEVAHLVAWLCTDASRFNTGAVFDMSGGRARY